MARLFSGVRRSVLLVKGDDARDFLHGLLTINVKTLPDKICRPGALCNSKGRVLATFLIWSAEGAFHLLTTTDVVELLKKTLLFYRLRSKVEVAVADCRCLGVDGENAGAFLIAQGIDRAPDKTIVVESNGSTLLGLLDGRILIVGNDLARLETSAETTETAVTGTANDWDWLDIIAGWPNITMETQGRFVAPQLNLDRLDAIDFKKGCYLGQEVVTRTHRLAKTPKKMFLFHGTVFAPRPGDPILRAGAPVGEIVSVQPAPEGGADMLVVLPVNAASAPLTDSTNNPIDPRPLPYAIDDTETSEPS